MATEGTRKFSGPCAQGVLDPAIIPCPMGRSFSFVSFLSIPRAIGSKGAILGGSMRLVAVAAAVGSTKRGTLILGVKWSIPEIGRSQQELYEIDVSLKSRSHFHLKFAKEAPPLISLRFRSSMHLEVQKLF